MKLYMKQKVFSIHHTVIIKDENENDRYSMKGEVLSLGAKLHIYDANGAVVAFVHQKFLALKPQYFIEIPGQETCELVKDKLLKQSYRLEGGVSWHLDGNLFEHEYMLKDNERIVMNLTKKWFAWGDSYELDIPNPDDELMSLCIALTVDCIFDESQQAAAATTTLVNETGHLLKKK